MLGRKALQLVDSERPMEDSRPWEHVQERRSGASEDRENALSGRPNIESIPTDQLISGLREATKYCPKGAYSKGGHSIKLLERIDPAKVRAGSAWAERLLSTLERMSR